MLYYSKLLLYGVANMRFFKKLTISMQMQILAAAMVLIVIFIILLTYYRIAVYSSEKTGEFTYGMISQTCEHIRSNCEQVNRTIQNVAYNSAVQDYLVETDAESIYRKNTVISAFLRNIKDLDDRIIDIIIVGENGNWVDLMGVMQIDPELEKKLGRTNAILYSEAKASDGVKMRSDHFIAAANIFNLKGTTSRYGDIIGKIGIVIDARKMGFASKAVLEQGYTQYYLLDRSDKVYFSSEPDRIGKPFGEFDVAALHRNTVNHVKRKQETYLVQVEELPYIEGRIIAAAPRKDVLSGVTSIQRETLLIFTLAIVVLAVPFALLINNILKPLKKFMDFMQSIQGGNLKNLKKRLELEGYAEISTVATQFNYMLDEIHHLTHQLLSTNTKLYEAELVKKQSELAMLQSQVNPHFLYNTLESIKGMALEEDASAVWKMTRALGQILKYSIKGPEIVALRDEIDIIRNYVEIQQCRFENRFEVSMDIDEDILDCHLPRMTLQPVIENAVYHGLETKRSQGRIEIIGREDPKGNIRLLVKDNGTGIVPEALMAIREKLAEDFSYRESDGSNRGIGIMNVNNRIKLIFGNAYGMDIDSEAGNGTTITMTLPCRRSTDV